MLRGSSRTLITFLIPVIDYYLAWLALSGSSGLTDPAHSEKDGKRWTWWWHHFKSTNWDSVELHKAVVPISPRRRSLNLCHMLSQDQYWSAFVQWSIKAVFSLSFERSVWAFTLCTQIIDHWWSCCVCVCVYWLLIGFWTSVFCLWT